MFFKIRRNAKHKHSVISIRRCVHVVTFTRCSREVQDTIPNPCVHGMPKRRFPGAGTREAALSGAIALASLSFETGSRGRAREAVRLQFVGRQMSTLPPSSGAMSSSKVAAAQPTDRARTMNSTKSSRRSMTCWPTTVRSSRSEEAVTVNGPFAEVTLHGRLGCHRKQMAEPVSAHRL